MTTRPCRLALLLVAATTRIFFVQQILLQHSLAFTVVHPQISSRRWQKNGVTLDGCTTRTSSLWNAASTANSSQEKQGGENDDGYKLHIIACTGVDEAELSNILPHMQEQCQSNEIMLHSEDMIILPKLNLSHKNDILPPGTLGRVMLLRIECYFEEDNENEEFLQGFQSFISQIIDDKIYSGELSQPILLDIRGDNVLLQNDNNDDIHAKLEKFCTQRIQEEIESYDLRTPLQELPSKNTTTNDSRKVLSPTHHVEIDGAFIQNEDENREQWDTSTILVLDDLITEDLRRRLLNVVQGREEDNMDEWDDTLGPDPSRWTRGDLSDIPNIDEAETNDEDNIDPSSLSSSPCWGLPEESIMDLCFNSHPAIADMESTLSKLFPNFVLSRMPEAVLGASVSPLTANAPTHGDIFDYHIDADTNLTPPSPWTDVFGRYPNRVEGKPRFISCLIYLNSPSSWNDKYDDETNDDTSLYGAPTKFYDPPTKQEYKVYPKPGRVVLLDQDITHSVVAPNAEAGKRPRYSLVWKLILHPKFGGQDMKNIWNTNSDSGNSNDGGGDASPLFCPSEDGALFIGSANKK